jgi:guanylate kinase
MAIIQRKGLLFCLLGPSGSGKSTLARKLLSEFKRTLRPSVSYTSRAPREGEVNGQHYYFVSRDEFIKKKDAGYFFEWEETHGNFYGTPKEAVENAINSGNDLILDIDIRGACSFRKAYSLSTVMVFLLPPTPESLAERMQARGSISDAEIQRRLETARKEYEMLSKTEVDYCVVNASLDDTYSVVRSILVAERYRALRLEPSAIEEFCKI